MTNLQVRLAVLAAIVLACHDRTRIATAAVTNVQAAARVGEQNLVLSEQNGLLTGAFRYQLVVGQFYEWNTDPTAVPGLLAELSRRTGVRAEVDFRAVGLDDPQMFRNPLLIITGNRVFHLAKEEIDNLRRYLLAGGFLYADDCGGSDFSFRRLLRQLFPDAPLEPLPPDHPLLAGFYPLKDVPKVVDLYGGPASAYSVRVNGRTAIVYTYDTDLPCAWERYPDGSHVHVLPETKREASLQFGVNMLLFALRQHLEPVTPVPPASTPDTRVAATPLPPSAVRNFPMRRQLPSNYIKALAANERYLWCGGFTCLPGEDEGLARLDKLTGEWRVFMDAEGILSEEVNCLALLDNKVLVGSDTWKWTKGMATFDTDTGRWTTLTSQDGLPHDRVVAIARVPDRTWIACRLGLAFLRDGQTRAETVNDPVFPQGGPFMIGLMADARYLWANHFAGIARFDIGTERWHAVSDLTPQLPGHVLDMAQAGSFAWFLAPIDEEVRVVRFNYETGEFRAWQSAEPRDWSTAASIAATERELFIGMRNKGGVNVFDIGTGALTQHWLPEHIPADQPTTVYRLFRDGDTLWAGVGPYAGLWRRDPATTRWELVPYRSGTPASHVLSLLEVDGRCYLGTVGSGPWCYEPAREAWHNLNLRILRNGKPYVYLGDRDAIRWDNIYALARQGSRVWMATNHGLILHDPERTPSGFEVLGPQGRIGTGLALTGDRVWMSGSDGLVTAFDPAKHAWQDGEAWTPGAPVRALCAWRDTLVAATAKGLLLRSADGATASLGGAEQPMENDVRGVWSAFGSLWYATTGGLYAIERSDQRPRQIEGSAAWGAAHAVCEAGNFLLIATERGLVRCDPTGRFQARYDRSSGLGADAIAAIAVTPDAIWLGTLGAGLSRIDRAALLAD